MNLEEMLESLPGIGSLAPEHREEIRFAMQERELPDGHAFIRQGGHADALWLVLEGEVAVEARRPEGGGFAVRRTMGPGSILGLVALIDHGPRSATCSARGPVRAAALPLEAARMLMDHAAPVRCAFRYALAVQLVRDARELNQELEESLRKRLTSPGTGPATR